MYLWILKIADHAMMAHNFFCVCTAIVEEDDIEKELHCILIKLFFFSEML